MKKNRKKNKKFFKHKVFYFENSRKIEINIFPDIIKLADNKTVVNISKKKNNFVIKNGVLHLDYFKLIENLSINIYIYSKKESIINTIIFPPKINNLNIFVVKENNYYKKNKITKRIIGNSKINNLIFESYTDYKIPNFKGKISILKSFEIKEHANKVKIKNLNFKNLNFVDNINIEILVNKIARIKNLFKLNKISMNSLAITLPEDIKCVQVNKFLNNINAKNLIIKNLNTNKSIIISNSKTETLIIKDAIVSFMFVKNLKNFVINNSTVKNLKLNKVKNINIILNNLIENLILKNCNNLNFKNVFVFPKNNKIDELNLISYSYTEFIDGKNNNIFNMLNYFNRIKKITNKQELEIEFMYILSNFNIKDEKIIKNLDMLIKFLKNIYLNNYKIILKNIKISIFDLSFSRSNTVEKTANEIKKFENLLKLFASIYNNCNLSKKKKREIIYNRIFKNEIKNLHDNELLKILKNNKILKDNMYLKTLFI